MKTRVENEFFYFWLCSTPRKKNQENSPQELHFSISYKSCMGAISLKHVTLYSLLQTAQNTSWELACHSDDICQNLIVNFLTFFFLSEDKVTCKKNRIYMLHFH